MDFSHSLQSYLITSLPFSESFDNIVALFVFASSSSSTSSSDSDKEIEHLESQSTKDLPPTLPKRKSKHRDKETSNHPYRSKTKSKVYRKQKYSEEDSYKKSKSKSIGKFIPKASGKCFTCGQKGHPRKKCQAKAKSLTNTLISNQTKVSSSTEEPLVNKTNKPETRLHEPKVISNKEVTINDLQKEIKETKSE
ncbi:hypothetical protein CFP56_042159, partial [Quercus suber]